MNRNLDGTLITTGQLTDLAIAIGVDVAAINRLHNTNLIRSALMDKTRQCRFDLFCTGFLRLDTR